LDSGNQKRQKWFALLPSWNDLSKNKTESE